MKILGPCGKALYLAHGSGRALQKRPYAQAEVVGPEGRSRSSTSATAFRPSCWRTSRGSWTPARGRRAIATSGRSAEGLGGGRPLRRPLRQHECVASAFRCDWRVPIFDQCCGAQSNAHVLRNRPLVPHSLCRSCSSRGAWASSCARNSLRLLSRHAPGCLSTRRRNGRVARSSPADAGLDGLARGPARMRCGSGTSAANRRQRAKSSKPVRVATPRSVGSTPAPLRRR